LLAEAGREKTDRAALQAKLDVSVATAEEVQSQNIQLMEEIATMSDTIKKNENMATQVAQSRLDKAEMEDAKDVSRDAEVEKNNEKVALANFHRLLEATICEIERRTASDDILDFATQKRNKDMNVELMTKLRLEMSSLQSKHADVLKTTSLRIGVMKDTAVPQSEHFGHRGLTSPSPWAKRPRC